MGNCLSCISDCLGIHREDPDHQPLLHPYSPHHNGGHGAFDPRHPHGGSHGYGGIGTREIDPQDQIREREALERIVASASMNLIDIVSLAPQTQQISYHHQLLQYTRNISAPSIPPNLPGVATVTNNLTTTNATNTATTTSATTTNTTTSPNPTSPPAHPAYDSKKLAIYRTLLQRTSPPSAPIMPEVLSPNVITEDERRWLDEIGERADEAVRNLTRVKDVGKVVVGLGVGLEER